MDDSTTIEKLKKMVISFRDERNWEQFHDPKNLAAGLSIESAELNRYTHTGSPMNRDLRIATTGPPYYKAGKSRLNYWRINLASCISNVRCSFLEHNH